MSVLPPGLAKSLKNYKKIKIKLDQSDEEVRNEFDKLGKEEIEKLGKKVSANVLPKTGKELDKLLDKFFNPDLDYDATDVALFCNIIENNKHLFNGDF